MKNKLTKLTLLTGLMFTTQQVYASCCAASTAQAVEQGLQKFNQKVSSELKEQSRIIQEISQNIANTAATNMSLTEKQIANESDQAKGLAKKKKNVMVQYATQKAILQAVQNFGYQNAPMDCATADRVTKSADENLAKIEETLGIALNEHLNGYTDVHDYINKVAKNIDIKDIDSNVLSPVSGYYDTPEKIKTAAQVTELILDDEPFIKPSSDAVYETLPGANYKKLFLQKKVKLLPVETALKKEVSYNTPSMPLPEWYEKVAEQTGMTISTATKETGLISRNQFLEMMVRAKFANPYYWADVHNSFGGDLQRKLIKTNAEQLVLEKELLDQQRMQSAMLASLLATETGNVYEKSMTEEYNRVVRVTGVPDSTSKAGATPE